MKPTVIVDFDGVLHSYASGWQGYAEIPDPPVEGAIEWLLELLTDGLQPAIYSSRSSSIPGRLAMQRWLRGAGSDLWLKASEELLLNQRKEADRTIAGFEAAGWEFTMGDANEEAESAGKVLVRACSWPWFKPPALVTLDDRAICFTGKFPSPKEIRAFKPWNK